MTGSVRLDRGGAVATITIDQVGRRNAMTRQMADDLREAVREVHQNPDDRVLVVTGAGTDFCSGFDLTEGFQTRAEVLGAMRRGGDAGLALHQLAIPTIARVRGVAAGLGWNLALQCDLVLAADTARFAQLFTALGLSIDFGGSWLLPRLVGRQRAKELVLLAEWVSAAEAQQLGLLNRAVPDGALDELVADWADRLAAAAPDAVSMSKRLLDGSSSISMAEALENEARAQALNAVLSGLLVE